MEEDAVRRVDNFSYAFIYYASLLFGTCSMTITSKTHQIVSYAGSLSWCLAVVANQVDHATKRWTEQRDETTEDDTAFERIMRLEFWTCSAMCLLGCSLPLTRGKAQLNAPDDSRTSRIAESFTGPARDARRTAVVLLFVAANAGPALCPYDDRNRDGAAYNSLFQDVCRLGALTADLQFVRSCWTLGDGLAELNARVLRTGAGAGRADAAYRTWAGAARAANRAYGARVLANVSCYVFSAVCGLFDAISAYRAPGARPAAVAVRLWRAANRAAGVTLVCVAASSVADQDERLHDSAQTARETFGDDSMEMRRFLRRLAYCKIKFNVCGMVTIDKTFLSSAVVSVISYLVIVLQYNYN